MPRTGKQSLGLPQRWRIFLVVLLCSTCLFSHVLSILHVPCPGRHQPFANLPGYKIVFDQCSASMVPPPGSENKEDLRIKKSPSLHTTKLAMVRHMSKRRSGDQQHHVLEGDNRCHKTEEDYPIKMAQHIAHALIQPEGLEEQTLDILRDLRCGFAVVAAGGRALHLARDALQPKEVRKKTKSSLVVMVVVLATNDNFQVCGINLHKHTVPRQQDWPTDPSAPWVIPEKIPKIFHGAPPTSTWLWENTRQNNRRCGVPLLQKHRSSKRIKKVQRQLIFIQADVMCHELVTDRWRDHRGTGRASACEPRVRGRPACTPAAVFSHRLRPRPLTLSAPPIF